MSQYYRIVVALAILLSGLVLVPQISLVSGEISWQRFVGAYEDVIIVTRARYKDGELEVRAQSTDPEINELKVYTYSSNVLIGSLEYEGDGEYRREFPWPEDPRAITVRSNSTGQEQSVYTTTDDSIPEVIEPPVSASYALYLPLVTR